MRLIHTHTHMALLEFRLQPVRVSDRLKAGLQTQGWFLESPDDFPVTLWALEPGRDALPRVRRIFGEAATPRGPAGFVERRGRAVPAPEARFMARKKLLVAVKYSYKKT
jgi:hypothetical protein